MLYSCTTIGRRKFHFRKPNIGMALQAKEEFPSIDFKKDNGR